MTDSTILPTTELTEEQRKLSVELLDKKTLDEVAAPETPVPVI
jgi:hypothetical protein